MTIETATYISSLNASYPASGDPKSEGDDHIRLVKSTVKATFPNVSGAVTPTHTELNYVDGVTSAIQTQLDAKAPLASPALTGTPTAPTATALTNSTQIATTAYTDAAVTALGATKANLASPALTGTPTAPTATAGTSTTQIATTEFVASTAFSAVLPAQTGNSGKYLTTDGSNASWGSIMPSGTAVLFAQTAAPTGWTKSTTHDNKALRVVSGTASSGGSVAFTTAFASQTPAGTVGNTTLSTSQMPTHTHTITYANNTPGSLGSTMYSSYMITGGTAQGTLGSDVNASAGTGGSHTHSFTGTAINLAVQYVDVIIATKD